jgi:hypothetical protein
VDEVAHRAALHVGHRRRVDREVAADGPRGGAEREGVAHDLPCGPDRLDALEDERHDGTAGHVGDQPAADRAADRQGIITARLAFDVEPRCLERLLRLPSERA